MKHQVKHLHFIAGNVRKGRGPCSGRPKLLLANFRQCQTGDK